MIYFWFAGYVLWGAGITMSIHALTAEATTPTHPMQAIGGLLVVVGAVVLAGLQAGEIRLADHAEEPPKEAPNDPA